jgi:hypothetical protein
MVRRSEAVPDHTGDDRMPKVIEPPTDPRMRVSTEPS